jgi:hypothetical protein
MSAEATAQLHARILMLRWIIHDWDEGCALRILDNIRHAMSVGGKLLLLEIVMPERAATAYRNDDRRGNARHPWRLGTHPR